MTWLINAHSSARRSELVEDHETVAELGDAQMLQPRVELVAVEADGRSSAQLGPVGVGEVGHWGCSVLRVSLW